MLSSASNAAFWLRLCSAHGQPGAQALLEAFGRAGEQGKQQAAAFSLQYNRDLVQKVGTLPIFQVIACACCGQLPACRSPP